jgi:hypothetical protein
MKERRMYRITGWIIVSILVLCMGSGCGGGGSSKGPGGSEGSTGPYLGLTSQVLITDKNSKDIMEKAYRGGTVSPSMNVFGAEQFHASFSSKYPITISLSRMIHAAFSNLDLSSWVAIPAEASAVVLPVNQTVNGECGGSYTIGFDLDSVTGSVSSGSIVYDKYCEEGVIESGSAGFSGQMDLVTKDMNLDFTYTNFTQTEGNDSETMNGTASFVSTLTTETITAKDLYVHDNTLNKTAWLNNFVITSTEESADSLITLNGRYYDPDYGYIDLSTESPGVILTGDENPSAGVLVGKGRNNTKARLTALTSTTYKVDADTDGDGVYDWNSGTLNW